MSANSTTNSIFDVVAEYQRSLPTSLEKGEDIKSIGEHFVNTLRKPEIKDQVIEDVQDMKSTAEDIIGTFVTIGVDFAELDGAKVFDSDGNPLQLSEQWHEYHRRFNEVMEKNFDNASRAASFMQQYSNAILADIDQLTYYELSFELKAFFEKLEHNAAGALQAKDESTKLVDDIHRFVQIVGAARASMGACLDDEVGAKGEAKIQERNRDNSETKAEVQLYKKHQEILAATKQATANIVRLTAKFDAISGIWQLFRSDVIQLQKEITLATDPDMPVTKQLVQRMAISREVYMRLATLLDMYAKCRAD